MSGGTRVRPLTRGKASASNLHPGARPPSQTQCPAPAGPVPAVDPESHPVVPATRALAPVWLATQHPTSVVPWPLGAAVRGHGGKRQNLGQRRSRRRLSPRQHGSHEQLAARQVPAEHLVQRCGAGSHPCERSPGWHAPLSHTTCRYQSLCSEDLGNSLRGSTVWDACGHLHDDHQGHRCFVQLQSYRRLASVRPVQETG